MTPPLAQALPDDVTVVPLPVGADPAREPWRTVKLWTIEAARDTRAVAHARLREILAAETGSDPQGLSFVRDPGTRGKPRLAGAPADLSFNLSHTHGLIAIAVARGREVGVDVEWLGRKLRSAGDDPAGKRAFLRNWTRREAYAKMTGEGLSRVLATNTGGEEREAEAGCHILELDLPPAHIGAVAIGPEKRTTGLEPATSSLGSSRSTS